LKRLCKESFKEDISVDCNKIHHYEYVVSIYRTNNENIIFDPLDPLVNTVYIYDKEGNTSKKEKNVAKDMVEAAIGAILLFFSLAGMVFCIGYLFSLFFP
jgi:hypothetical protein